MKLKIIVRKNGKIERYIDNIAYDPLLFLERLFPETTAKWPGKEKFKIKEGSWDIYLTLNGNTSPTVKLSLTTTLSAKEIFDETMEAVRSLQQWITGLQQQADSFVESEYEADIEALSLSHSALEWIKYKRC